MTKVPAPGFEPETHYGIGHIISMLGTAPIPPCGPVRYEITKTTNVKLLRLFIGIYHTTLYAEKQLIRKIPKLS